MAGLVSVIVPGFVGTVLTIRRRLGARALRSLSRGLSGHDACLPSGHPRQSPFSHTIYRSCRSRRQHDEHCSGERHSSCFGRMMQNSFPSGSEGPSNHHRGRYRAPTWPQRIGASDGPFVVHYPQIQVHPVLRSLGFGDLQEEGRYRSHVEVDVAVLIGSLDTSAQQPASPIRKDLRVACVEAHPADRRDHILFTVVMPTLSVGLRLLAGCRSSSALARSSNQRSAFNSTARWR